jgi:hypothetical protein
VLRPQKGANKSVERTAAPLLRSTLGVGSGAPRALHRPCPRRSLTSHVRCDMKSYSPLLSVGNLTKPCLSRQVFQGSMRWTGGGNATVQGVKPSRQCSQPGSLNPGAALESDGTVKLVKHLQASSKERATRGCFKAQAKIRPAVRFGLSNVARRECRTAGVQSGPNPSRDEYGTWKRCGYPAWISPGKPTARQAQGAQH